MQIERLEACVRVTHVVVTGDRVPVGLCLGLCPLPCEEAGEIELDRILQSMPKSQLVNRYIPAEFYYLSSMLMEERR